MQCSLYLWLIWQIANNIPCTEVSDSCSWSTWSWQRGKHSRLSQFLSFKEENLTCFFSHVIILNMRTPHFTSWQWPHHCHKGHWFQALFLCLSFCSSMIIFSVMLTGFLQPQGLAKISSWWPWRGCVCSYFFLSRKDSCHSACCVLCQRNIFPLPVIQHESIKLISHQS